MERGYKRAGRVSKAVPRCIMQTRFKKRRKSVVDVGVGVKWRGIGRNINKLGPCIPHVATCLIGFTASEF